MTAPTRPLLYIKFFGKKFYILQHSPKKMQKISREWRPNIRKNQSAPEMDSLFVCCYSTTKV